MAMCEACNQAEGVNHVTVTVTLFGPKTTRKKTVQFWLCEACEIKNQQIMAGDHNQRRRVALRMTQDPEFFSRWREWRVKRQQQAAVRYGGEG